MKHRRAYMILSLLLAAALTFGALPLTPVSYAAGSYTLPLFETSDTHGYLADTSGADYQYRLAYISDKVKDVRGRGDAYRSDLALLLDGGDIYQGNALSNLLDGQSLAAAYELMDYDAVTIGNHEFDWGIGNTVQTDKTMMDSDLDGAKIENDTPVVISNLYQNGKKVDFAQDYVILQKTAVDAAGNELPVRVGVIGFAEDYSSSIMYGKFTGAGYTIVPDFSIAENIAAELEANGECDVTLLLCHAAADEMAKELSVNTAVDLVLGGHTHVNNCGIAENGTPYIQPACYGQAYAYAELTFSSTRDGAVFSGVQNTGSVSTTEDTGRLFNLPENADDLDADIVALSDLAIGMIDDVLVQEIGYITVPIYRYQYLPFSGERSTTAGNWMCSIIRRTVDADVGFVNSGGIRLDIPFEEGEVRHSITAADVYAMFPFENLIYCFELTYEDLLTLLQYSMTSGGKGLLSRVDGIDCYFTDGTVNAIVTAEGETVYLNGAFKGDWREKTLRVAVSEYVVTTDRPTGDFHNPLPTWSETDRLLSKDTVDIEGALPVLKEEAAENGGLLYVDDRPHFICKAYEEPETPDTPDTPSQNVATVCELCGEVHNVNTTVGFFTDMLHDLVYIIKRLTRFFCFEIFVN